MNFAAYGNSTDRDQMRMTLQRKIIVEELRKMKNHPTADQLYEAVRKRLPSISLGTVYRNLEFLSDKGIIHRVEVCGKKRRYDGTLEEHTHIRCAVCGRIEDIVEDQNLQSLAETIISKTGFELIAGRTEFVGICPECRLRRGVNRER